MSTVKSRRDLYAEATRAALVDEATALFAERGFAATSLDDVARAANVTRGAVYHHFTGKKDLFSAVAEEQERLLIERVAAALHSHDDVWEASMAAIEAFLDAALDPVYSTVVWREGLTALGWDGLKACAEKYSLGLIQNAADALIAAGHFDGAARDVTTKLIFHLFGGAALTLATAEDKPRARAEVGDAIRRMITGLRIHP